VLLAYWLLTIPSLGERLLQLFRRFPSQRNIFRRALEPLLADEIEAPAESKRQASDLPINEGVELFVNGASVALAGRAVLENIHLRVGAGEQVAIVGMSGSGKSTLLRLLLGLRPPDRGQVLWDGEALSALGSDRLYESTVWIDPSVRLWNRSLLENVLYGADGANIASTTEAIADAQIDQVIGNAPEGLRSLIGEAGVTLSGGEGQRTRFARGLVRENPRFVVLDEPFRGLDHSARKEFLALSRRRWRNATMICVTHDIAETLEFDRVIVLRDGRVIEDGAPHTLSEVLTSAYRRLLDAERVACRDTWGAAMWRRVRLEKGAIANRKARDEFCSIEDESSHRASFPHATKDRHERS
jgi:ATP-binding cassette subfamily B protein